MAIDTDKVERIRMQWMIFLGLFSVIQFLPIILKLDSSDGIQPTHWIIVGGSVLVLLVMFKTYDEIVTQTNPSNSLQALTLLLLGLSAGATVALAFIRKGSLRTKIRIGISSLLLLSILWMYIGPFSVRWDMTSEMLDPSSKPAA